MSVEQDDQPNDKLIKLVKKVKTLSKIVNQLEVEVDDLKSRLLSEKKDAPIPQESQIVESEGSKLNRSQRLNIFRTDNKTKEKIIDPTIDKPENVRATGDENVNSKVHFKTTPELIDRQQQTANQLSRRETVNNNSNRRNRSTQSLSIPEEIEFSFIVRTLGVQTEKNLEGSVRSHEDMAFKPNVDGKSTCKRCNKTKKLKVGRCDKDCPYLVKYKEDDKKKKKNYKSLKKDASVENYHKEQSDPDKEKKYENKEVMANHTKQNKMGERQLMSNNDQSSFEDKLIDSSSRSPKVENNDETKKSIPSSDHGGKSIKVEKIFCKNCFLKRLKNKNKGKTSA